jgi:hypothetical protein
MQLVRIGDGLICAISLFTAKKSRGSGCPSFFLAAYRGFSPSFRRSTQSMMHADR